MPNKLPLLFPMPNMYRNPCGDDSLLLTLKDPNDPALKLLRRSRNEGASGEQWLKDPSPSSSSFGVPGRAAVGISLDIMPATAAVVMMARLIDDLSFFIRSRVGCFVRVGQLMNRRGHFSLSQMKFVGYVRYKKVTV